MIDPDETELYKTAYNREKIARREAEDILEDKTLELYAINRQLQKTNELLRGQQKSLVKTEKLVALGQLSAGVAHEINNPLAFVVSNFNSLKKYFKEIEQAIENAKNNPQDPTFVEFIQSDDFDFIQNDSNLIFNEIHEGLERVKDIVGNLKSFSRTTTTDRSNTTIAEIIESALKLSHNETKYHCQIEINIEDDVPEIYCNKNQLVQVFINLVVNAAQALSKSGNIKIHAHANEDYIVIDVSDTGCGIPADKIDRVFDPFYTSKPLGEGTGLGLSVSYGIIKDMDGTISVESAQGEGSTFTVLLPID